MKSESPEENGIAVETREPRLSREKNKINFVNENETRLFCYSTEKLRNPAYLDAAYMLGKWCNRTEALNFVKKLPETPWTSASQANTPSSRPSFTFIGGHGNGTLHPLSLDHGLFEETMKILQLPEKIREVICSIHGVFARFIEYEGDTKKSLLLLLSTPKAPVREIFCVLRIVPEPNAVTCLLFDAQPIDLFRVVDIICNSQHGASWKSAVTLLVTLFQEIGHTSELKREVLDSYILGTEVQTKSTPWDDPNKALVRWPKDIHEATSVLHLCNNNLLFVARAIEFEIDAWRCLQRMMKDTKLESWLKGKAGEGEWTGLLDDVEFEMMHTVNRKAQIGCLKDRIDIQINLINNLIAHQETSQTNLIAILALVFAPASLVASIFSAGIFATDNRSWIAYVGSTVPIMFLTVVAGISFLEQKKLLRAWRALKASIRLQRQSSKGGEC